jgi:hypothetical protein
MWSKTIGLNLMFGLAAFLIMKEGIPATVKINLFAVFG